MNRLTELAQENAQLNHEMQLSLMDYVREQGGMVDLQEEDVYGYLVGDYGQNEECQIVAMSIFDGELCVLFTDGCFDYTKEDLEESEGWYTIGGDYVLAPQTLLNLCTYLGDKIINA